MNFPLILVICLALFVEEGPTAAPDPGLRLGCTGLGVALAAFTADLLARAFARQLRRAGANRNHILQRYGRWRLCHFCLTLAIYLLTVLPFGNFGLAWATLVRVNGGLHDAVLLDEILLLAPLVCSLLLGWASFYRVEQALHETNATTRDVPFWTRGQYVVFHFRLQLGLILAVILFFRGAFELIASLQPEMMHAAWFQSAVLGVVAVNLLVVIPWLLTVILGVKSLPPGPLRDRLTATAARLGFRYSDILHWETHGGVANALVTGLLPCPRYVLLSDGLVRDLPPEEVEAVLGHEIGHVKHLHMPLYLSFMILSILLLSAVMQWVQAHGPFGMPASLGTVAVLIPEWSSYLAAPLFLGGYIWLVFGFLSRRCERQADVYGCRAVSCGRADCRGHDGTTVFPTGPPKTLCPTGVRIFIRALERVADLNGIQRNKRMWLHSSFGRRLDFLEQLYRNPGIERSFQLRMLLIRWGLLLALTGLLSATIWSQGLSIFELLEG